MTHRRRKPLWDGCGRGVRSFLLIFVAPMELGFDLLLSRLEACSFVLSSWPPLRDRQCRHAALCCPIETSSDVGMIGMITRRAWSYRVGAFFLPYVIPAAPPVRFLVATGPPSTKALANNGEPFGTFFRRVRHAYVQSLRYVRRRWSWASTAET